MKFIADLHIHSRYSRACSKDLGIDTLEKWARIKGIDLIGTGDAQHPEYFKELKEKLVREEKGIYYTKTGFPFLLTTEISLIYSQEENDGKKGRRIHLVLLIPNLETINKLQSYLLNKGRIDYDGRPIFKISCRDFVKSMKELDERIEIIPAHAWTPWFGIYGSKGGFDSLKKAFGDQLKHIHAIETGISSDIEMNDAISENNNLRYVSFSDAHSFWPWRLGREATIFEFKNKEELTYDNIIKAIKTGEGFWGTIEVEPSYGKYHYDGHRACGIVMNPEETKKNNGICPVCKKPLTIGVHSRIVELQDKPFPKKKDEASQKYYKLLPLHEILSMILKKGLNTKAVWDEYWKIMKIGKNEFDILLNKNYEELIKVTSPSIAKAIINVREEKVTYSAGYDGVYGVPHLLREEKEELEERKTKNVKRTDSKSKQNQKGLVDYL